MAVMAAGVHLAGSSICREDRRSPGWAARPCRRAGRRPCRSRLPTCRGLRRRRRSVPMPVTTSSQPKALSLLGHDGGGAILLIDRAPDGRGGRAATRRSRRRSATRLMIGIYGSQRSDPDGRLSPVACVAHGLGQRARAAPCGAVDPRAHAPADPDCATRSRRSTRKIGQFRALQPQRRLGHRPSEYPGPHWEAGHSHPLLRCPPCQRAPSSAAMSPRSEQRSSRRAPSDVFGAVGSVRY